MIYLVLIIENKRLLTLVETARSLQMGNDKKNVRVSTLTKTFKICDKTAFPNLFTLINIAATLPLTSYKREQSFSLIRRFRTWIRASMIHERFSSLALMYIH